MWGLCLCGVHIKQGAIRNYCFLVVWLVRIVEPPTRCHLYQIEYCGKIGRYIPYGILEKVRF